MMDREIPNQRNNLKSSVQDEWAPQRVDFNRRASDTSIGSNSRGRRRSSLEGSKDENYSCNNIGGGAKSNMFESFRNLEDAMALAKRESLQSAGVGLGDTKKQSLVEVSCCFHYCMLYIICVYNIISL